MDKQISERVVDVANYILKTRGTIRSIASNFGVSKSTIHKDLSERLIFVNNNLFEQVKDLLEYNKSVRHLRGGNSTKLKYLNKNNDYI